MLSQSHAEGENDFPTANKETLLIGNAVKAINTFNNDITFTT